MVIIEIISTLKRRVEKCKYIEIEAMTETIK